MRSPILKLGLLFFIVGLIGLGVKIGTTASFFSDTETSTENTFSTADSFPQTALLYDSNSYTCSGGASSTGGPTFGSVTIEKDGSTVVVDASLIGATPDSSYDIWINQDPGACPLSQPTRPDALTTDESGDGEAHVEVTFESGSTEFWISAVGGGQVLRSTSVSF